MKGKKKQRGLALGGGAVLGAAHIGVLRALDERNLSVDFISGTSIGALVAAFYAFGRNWSEIEEIARDLNWLEVSGLSLSKYGLLSNKKIAGLIRDNLGEVDIQEADIPLAVVAADISTGEKIIISEGDVATAVMASTCIPGVFIPVERDGRLLVDGGVVENVPVSPLVEMGAKTVIAVDLTGTHSYEKPDNIVDVLLNAFYMTFTNTTRIGADSVDILISPDLSSFSPVKTKGIEHLIETGYNEALDRLPDG